MDEHQRICSIENCGKPAYLKSFCNAHYIRLRRHGHPLGGRKTNYGEPRAWIRQMVADALRNETKTCIDWPFADNGNGYGWAFFDGHRIGAHRLSVVLATGVDEKGKVAAHLCHNRRCVNPNHLVWATQAENVAHRERDGTMRAKLNRSAVNEIRASQERVVVLAERYRVSGSTIYLIKSGKIWK